MGRQGRIARFRAGVIAGVALAAASVAPAPTAAQLTDECAAQVSLPDVQRYCNLVARTVELTVPRLGMGLSGGNPVPGTASTLGMRLGTLPRMSLAIRATAVATKIPDIREQGATDELTFPLGSVNADGTLGLFSGFSPAPTVGGVGSIDLLASVGLIPVPGGEGFDDGAPLTWAAGARVGLLRESFTMPGLSVSAMYRRLGDVTYGDEALQDDDAFFDTELSALSLRAAVSKDVLMFALTAGAGWDRYTSDVTFGVSATQAGLPVRQELRIEAAELETDRITFFGNVALNFLVLYVVAEGGWQSGTGDLPAVTMPAGVEQDPNDGAIYGSLAIRFSI